MREFPLVRICNVVHDHLADVEFLFGLFQIMFYFVLFFIHSYQLSDSGHA